MEKPYRIGFTPLVEVPKKKKFDWNKFGHFIFKVVVIIAIIISFGLIIRTCRKEELKSKELDNQCKAMGAIDVYSCADCLTQSSITNDPRCGLVNRWNAK